MSNRETRLLARAIIELPTSHQPTHAGLPDLCYYDASKLPNMPARVILIQRGVSGYRTIPENDVKGEPADYCARMNASLDVSGAQREAMLFGTLFGWQTPGANPLAWQDDGSVRRTPRLVVKA